MPESPLISAIDRPLHTSFVSFSGMISGSFLDRSVTACFILATAALSVSAPPALAQNAKPDSSTMRSLAQDNSILTLQAGQKLAQEGSNAYNAGNFPLAVKKLQESKLVLGQVSDFHQVLVGAFGGLNSKISASARDRAVRSAQSRDEATYDLARTHRALKQADLAVPLLVQVLRSQQSTRELGQKAYNELLQIGFMEIPYSGQREPEGKKGKATEAPPAVPVAPVTPELALVSLAGGENLLNEAKTAIAAGNYTLAQTKLKESRSMFTLISKLYEDLLGVFSGVDTPIANSSRDRALAAAEKRDEATYQLALVHRAMNQPELSVPLLIQVIKSQQVTRVLGKKAYAQLIELGFSENIPYNR
jgi:hypothetical protein